MTRIDIDASWQLFNDEDLVENMPCARSIPGNQRAYLTPYFNTRFNKPELSPVAFTDSRSALLSRLEYAAIELRPPR